MCSSKAPERKCLWQTNGFFSCLKRLWCERVHTKEIGKNLFLIDLETGGLHNIVASYVLKGAKTIIVETGPFSSICNLLSGLRELNVKAEDVAYVAISHVHIDHGGGAGTLLKLLPNAKVIAHPKGVPHLVNPEKLWLQTKEVLGNVAETFGEPVPVPEDRIIAATDYMTFEAGTVKLKVIETLGHASHHLSYYYPICRGIFPGDAAGIYISQFDVVVPTTPPPFCVDFALASLEKLIRLNPKSLYFSHFGNASDAVKRLQEHALQIQLWEDIAREGVENKQSLEEIRDRIISEDKVMRKLAGCLKLYPIYVKTVLENSVQGFIEFAEMAQS
jgi:glyoxylase-like metal-dependent hydrolase (beta-lactamase superfamily II)